ncbi:hypothetical protein I3760_15G123300 [Carya illinoinensis]|nr:hypothetical protein I3760_15G123300 [Carya illinoinensis]
MKNNFPLSPTSKSVISTNEIEIEIALTHLKSKSPRALTHLKNTFPLSPTLKSITSNIDFEIEIALTQCILLTLVAPCIFCSNPSLLVAVPVTFSPPLFCFQGPPLLCM